MPKRAIVYFCWGQKFIEEAAVSSQTTAFLGIDRILITNEESRAFLPPNAPFQRVITHAITLPGYLPKAQVAQLLPDEYDSFLLLDPDTHILMDISMGFQKAEAHGIAAVRAPHYSLEHFWGFDRVMDSLAFPKADILQYNTGVIFFARRPDVWAVLNDWYDLCRTIGVTDYQSDQPFFTIAMERRGFNPYTLSIAYNYRNFGEYISGMVRIWHSHLPPPPDVNVFTQPWPPRSFKNGVRTDHVLKEK